VLPVEARKPIINSPRKLGKGFFGAPNNCLGDFQNYFQKIEMPMVVGFVFFAPARGFIAGN
jgi:hypothetical protein